MAKIEVRLNPDVPPTGSDLAVVNAARRSFNTRSEWVYDTTWGSTEKGLSAKDKRLLHFLARGMTAGDFETLVDEMAQQGKMAILEGDSCEWDGLIENMWKWRNTPTHDTPFNHCWISFEVKAPIFVARQLVKHEYLIMSEFSRRYITDDVEFYEPDFWRKSAPNKKQGSLEEPVDWVTCPSNLPNQANEMLLGVYKKLIAEGIAPEQARMVLPQSLMTEWTWSGTLGAFAKMCQLRMHPEAQYEARIVANDVYGFLEKFFPVSAKALVKGTDY